MKSKIPTNAEQTLIRRTTFCGLLFFVMGCGWAQENSTDKPPKLVVGIMVDQMRYEYLHRFYSKFGDGGFRRLMNEGFNLKNAHYNYAPTITGPGHASVYTGTTPSIHGIIGNSWYDKNLRKQVNCVNDPDQTPVGEENGNGAVSPWRMLTTTITDELKLASQNRSKVIGLSMKDRGAVLPAGHMADAAYWYDSNNGRFISSTFYMAELPAWVQNFNSQKLPDKYLSRTWNTVYPITQYGESNPDVTLYESTWAGKSKPAFPYELNKLREKNGNYELLVRTPFCNDLITEFARSAIDNEKLGQTEWTDFLAVSYSQPDIIGHLMGPYAVEVEDTYIRLDKNIEQLLNTLDQKIGKGKYVVFLTADHAVADGVQFLMDNKVPAGYFNEKDVKTNLTEYLGNYYPDKVLIEDMSNNQITFSDDVFQKNPKCNNNLLLAPELVSEYLLTADGVADVYTEAILRQGLYDEGGIKGMIMRGYHPKRSGDIVYVLEPGWYSASRTHGSTHGSPYTYDTHVPMLFFGAGIKQGSSVRYHTITEIAPTLSVLLKIKFPSGSTGQPLEEVLK